MAKTNIRGTQILDGDINTVDIAFEAVQGSTSNSGGTHGEIALGTVSTPDLRNGAVSAAKILSTDIYTVGGILNADGTVASPSFSFASDTNTGFYRIASHVLGIAINGTERIRIIADGTVGIGGAPVTNGLLTLTSTTQAFVPPRMTSTQMTAITSPIAGMVVYNSTSNAVNVYNGSAWVTPPITETDPLSIHLDGSTSPSANINWNGHQITNLVMQTGTSEPGSPSEGQLFYNTTTHQAEIYNGTSWVLMG